MKNKEYKTVSLRMPIDKFGRPNTIFCTYYAEDLLEHLRNICKSEHAYSYEFIRIIEILWDYWISEPEEDEVEISMHFRKGDEEQYKDIYWERHTESSEEKEM